MVLSEETGPETTRVGTERHTGPVRQRSETWTQWRFHFVLRNPDWGRGLPDNLRLRNFFNPRPPSIRLITEVSTGLVTK